MMSSISIIIPVYNSISYLAECLDSILAQTFTDFEVILVDDCSTDGSWEVLRSYASKDARFSLFQMEKNSGAGAARNRGIERAIGKYCLFCDPDDAYPSYALEKLFISAEKKQVDVSCGNIFAMDRNLRYYNAFDGLHAALLIKNEQVVYNLEHPSLWWPLYHPKFLILRKLLLDNSIQYPLMRRGQDPVFLAQVLCSADSVALIPDAVYFYRTGGSKAALDSRSWLEYLDHFKATLEVFLAAKQVRCASLFYVLSISAWHNFSQWRRLTRAERLEERIKFEEYAKEIAPYKPWEQNFSPYPIDIDKLRAQEACYLRYGHGVACLHMAIKNVCSKLARIFRRTFW